MPSTWWSLSLCFPPRAREGPGPHLDAEAKVRGQPVQLAALRHHVHVGLIHIRHVLQMPRVLSGTSVQDLVQGYPILLLLPSSQGRPQDQRNQEMPKVTQQQRKPAFPRAPPRAGVQSSGRDAAWQGQAGTSGPHL